MTLRYESSAIAARSIGATVQPLGVREPDNFNGVFEAMGREDKHSLSFNGHVLHTSLSGI